MVFVAAIQAKRRRERLYVDGLCSSCGKNPFIAPSKRCAGCLGRENELYHRARRNVIDHYGGSCVRCHEKLYNLLTIDHIDGGGNAHRKSTTPNVARWLQSHGYPTGYQVLCWNHNYLKYLTTRSISARIESLRNEIFSIYGKSCSCCQIDDRRLLTIDHPGGNGAEERRSVGVSSWYRFYEWLKASGFPSGYDVLCFSCNSGRETNGGICPHVGGKTYVMRCP